jgi:hypothetical protein
MEIKSTIIKNGKIYGMFIADGSETYPIRVESLHTPMILDTLLDQGWELHALPYELRKGASKLEDLPSIPYHEAGITEAQEQEMIDMMSHRYKDVDLKAKLVKSPINYIQFNKGTNQIKTREALVKFLNETVSTDVDLNVPTAWMPLNSFVEKLALFTPEEYFHPENADVRELIERRRMLSFKNFERLVRFMVATGMEENYSPKDLVDRYFAWGICGIKFDAYERKNDRSNIILGAPVRHSLSETEMPYVRMRHLTFIDTAGKIFKNANTQTGQWSPVMREAGLEGKRKEAFNAGFNYVSPVYVESVIDETVTAIHGDTLTVEYTDERLLLTHNGLSMSSFTLRVRRLDNPFKFLPSRFWNISSQENKRALFEEFYMNALCRELSDKTTVHADVSSYKALQTTGSGPRSVFTYMLEKNDQFKDIMKEANDDPDLFILRVEEYMKGTLNPNLSYFGDVESFVQDVLDGATNIDNTAEGQEADNMGGYETIYQAIYVAHKYLEVPLDDIYQQIKSLHPDTPYIDFVGPEKAVRLEISKRDAKLKGYIADMKNYRREQARDAKEWHWVSSVYRELGPVSPDRKHAAVDVLTFYREKKTEAIENYILNIVNETIANNVPYAEQGQYKDFLYIIVANALFEAGLKGTITFPPALGGQVIQIDDATKTAIASYFDKEFESTVGISETTVGGDGKFNRYFINAVVMPEYVLPNKGFTLKEYPFIPMWLNTAGMDDFRRAWFEKGLIPRQDYYGMSNYYKDKALLRGRHDWNNDRTSLYWYYKNSEEFRTEFPTDKEFISPPHMIEALYPVILDYDVEERAIEARHDQSKLGVVHKFTIGEIVELTRESVLERFPELMNYFEAQPKLMESKQGFHRFEGYEAEDFYFLKSLDKLPTSPDFSGKHKLLAVLSKTEACLDEVNSEDFKYTEVVDMSPETHAVVNVRGRKYLMEDIKGILWEVRA